jgi:DNA-binding NarL/FixJ family response regulator
MEESIIDIIIVEDDSDIRESLEILLNGSFGFNCIAAYSNCEDAISEFKNKLAQVILLDIDLPGMSGIEGIKEFKKILPEVDIVMMTVHEDAQMVFEALKAGACGYLTKNIQPSKILESLKEIHNGGAPMSTNIARMLVQSFQTKKNSNLSERETEVLSLLCQGQSYKIIAGNLFISEDTVHFHIKNIYKKLQVHSKSEAVSKALRENLI